VLTAWRKNIRVVSHSVNLFHALETRVRAYLSCNAPRLKPSPFATGGGLVGLFPQTKLQAPSHCNMKHYKSVEFLSIFRMSTPLHKRKDPLLKTFWRRFYQNTLARWIWPRRPEHNTREYGPPEQTAQIRAQRRLPWTSERFFSGWGSSSGICRGAAKNIFSSGEGNSGEILFHQL